MIDTNVSRHRHTPAIGFASDGARSGFRYTCPRCGWLSPIMRWRQGAERHGDEHAVECRP